VEKPDVRHLAKLAPDLFGIDIDAQRLAAILGDINAVLSEIKKLRSLELGDISPVVVFDPMTGYRDGHDA